MTAKPKTRAKSKSSQIRKRMLALIHIFKGQLDWEDADYRAMLQQQVGKTSAADCSDAELGRVLDWFKAQGCVSNNSRPQPKNQVDKIVALWNELHRVGKLSNDNADLNAWVHRQFKVQRVEWLSVSQKSQAIEMLKKWLTR